jgi:hypothetical protein
VNSSPLFSGENGRGGVAPLQGDGVGGGDGGGVTVAVALAVAVVVSLAVVRVVARAVATMRALTLARALGVAVVLASSSTSADAASPAAPSLEASSALQGGWFPPPSTEAGMRGGLVCLACIGVKPLTCQLVLCALSPGLSDFPSLTEYVI